MNSLKIVKLKFETTVKNDVLFPGYLGNTIRGALGNSLAHLFCSLDADNPEKRPDCRQCSGLREKCILCEGVCKKNKEKFDFICPHATDCVYGFVYKNRTIRGYSVPNPFVVEVPNDNKREYKKGENLCFSISLFGSAVGFSEHIITAVEYMLQGRFATYYNCIRLNRVADFFTNETVYENERQIAYPYQYPWSDAGVDGLDSIEKIKITFISPAQLLNSRDELILDLSFPVFIDRLFARIADIIDVYGDSAFILPYNLCFKKPLVHAEPKLFIKTVKQEKQTIEGLKGTLVFRGDLTRYMPYIDLGAQLHIGKLATRGFGEYAFKIVSGL